MRFPISPFRVLISLVWQEPCYSSTSVDPERNVKGGPYEKGVLNKKGGSGAFIP
jgi:hypothetical protein